MKRMHIHLSVENIEQSIGFYTKLFGAEPSVVKSDYAKWMLDDPRVNFAMSSHEGAKRGVEHVGIQAESHDELAQVYGRIKEAGGAIFDEGATTCCYAQSEKNWTADPDGLAWEAFLTHGDVTEYGNRVDLDQLASGNAAENACCTPAMAPTAVDENADNKPCCG
ncbi:ArsI/CadI family heavy metal resistance metalloenzyme [Parasphingorhabdus sp.]|uniref:ArsI/CadI family heavy metal resistance metalloenzyme n=1 Tax=Parasphingorhabdus sp. TaxID=2709688 RepID=UPI002F9225BF